MPNPNDPNAPMYQGQALQQQAPARGGFHLLEGIGNLVLAGAHFFSGGSDDESETEEEQRPAKRRVRTFGARPSGRVGAGSCCRRPSSK